MDTKIMGEKLCALSNNEIIKRRKPILAPLALAALGAAVLVLTTLYISTELESLKVGLLLLGWTLVIVGGILASLRYFDSEGAPYDLRTGSYLKPIELYFSREQTQKVLECCRKGDISTLQSLSQSSISAIIVAVYKSSDDRWWACQPYEYIELEYRPIDEMRMHRKS